MLGFHTSNSNVEVVLHTSEGGGGVGGWGNGFLKSFGRKIPRVKLSYSQTGMFLTSTINKFWLYCTKNMTL